MFHSQMRVSLCKNTNLGTKFATSLDQIESCLSRGRCPEWYNRVYGHQCALLVERLRDSFRQEADGPETKV